MQDGLLPFMSCINLVVFSHAAHPESLIEYETDRESIERRIGVIIKESERY